MHLENKVSGMCFSYIYDLKQAGEKSHVQENILIASGKCSLYKILLQSRTRDLDDTLAACTTLTEK